MTCSATWRRTRALRTLVTLALVLALIGCVSRDNPWDPINYTPPAATLDCTDSAAVSGTRDTLTTFVDAQTVGSLAGPGPLDSAAARFALDTIAHTRNAARNDSLRALNTQRRADNSTAVSANDTTTDPAALRDLQPLDTLGFFAIAGVDSAMKASITDMLIARLRIDSAVGAANARCALGAVASDSLRGAWLWPFDSALAAGTALADQADSLARAASDTGRLVVAPYNAGVRAANDSIRVYNDSLRFIRQSHRFTPITSSNTLEQLLLVATPGDTFVVAAGEFDPVIRFANNGGDSSAPIAVIGQPSMTTVFIAADVILSNTRFVTFRNIVFRRSSSTGAKIEFGSREIVFDHCWFDSNSTHGIEIIDSDTRLIDCRIWRNGACGLRSGSSSNPTNTVTIENSLIASNAASGIELLSTVLRMRNVTIAGNGDGVLVKSGERELSVLASVVAFNRLCGLSYEAGGVILPAPTLVATVLVDNSRAALCGLFEPPPAYLTLQTAFTDTASGIYGIAPGCALDSLQNAYPGLVIGWRSPWW